MPKVTMPNGTAIDFPEGTDSETINRVSADWWKKNGPNLENTGQLGEARATGVLQGALAGFGDEFLG